MKQVSHKISKLIFEVSMKGDENQMKRLQSEIEQIISTHIAEALDKPLSLFANENVDFIIEKLEIDIGSFDLKTDKKKLFKTISEKVEEEIRKVSKTIETQDGHSPVKAKTKDTSEFELVFYILRNGHLPWWADSDKKVNVVAFFKQFIQKATDKQIVHLKDQLVNPVFRKRLIHYLSETELIGCGNILMPSFISSNKEIVEACKTSSLFKAPFFDLLFELPNQKNTSHIQEITETIIELLLDFKIAPKVINLEALLVPTEMRSRLKSIQLSAEKQKDFKRKPIDSKEKSDQKRNQLEREKSAQTENNIVDETENSIEIGNAGLVLILSFLSRFFENIGMATSKGFNSVTEQHAGVYLLRYIATGSLDLPQEHELFFEKLICGIETDEVLMPFSEFKQSQLDEVEDLLTSIIENWKAVKSSSPKTLQSAFLQRSGYLIQRDDGAWSLHIERQTIDILLNKIPWTISIGRIPFSSVMIYTEW